MTNTFSGNNTFHNIRSVDQFDRSGDQFEAAADRINGDRQSAIIRAIDAYTKRNGGTLDLSNESGWHRTQLAFDIVDALRGIK